MVVLDFSIEIVLEPKCLFHFLYAQAVAVQLGKVQNYGVVYIETFHPFQLFIQKETGIGNRAAPIFLKHKFSVLIYPKNTLVLHKLRNFLGVGKQVGVAVDAEFSFHKQFPPFGYRSGLTSAGIFLIYNKLLFKVTNFYGSDLKG
jgi:hypothetical protein